MTASMIILIILLTLVFAITWSSFFEWWVHKNIMHNPNTRFQSFYLNHKHHHDEFKHDKSYHKQHNVGEEIIHMIKWSWAIIGTGSVPYILFYLTSRFVFDFREVGEIVLMTGVLFSITYYIVYEYNHYCMHLPKGRRLETTGPFEWQNANHLLHHFRRMNNFNVVCPIADWWMGTLITQAPRRFDQPGAPVPNVQPRGEQTS